MRIMVETRSLLSNILSRILAQSCVANPLSEYVGREKVGPPKWGVATLPTTPTGLDGGMPALAADLAAASLSDA